MKFCRTFQWNTEHVYVLYAVQSECASICRNSAYRLGRHSCLFVYLSIFVCSIHILYRYFFSSVIRCLYAVCVYFHNLPFAPVCVSVSCFVCFGFRSYQCKAHCETPTQLVYIVCASKNMVLSHFIQIVFREWCLNCCSFGWFLFFGYAISAAEHEQKHYLNGALSAEMPTQFSFIISEQEKKSERERETQRMAAKKKKCNQGMKIAIIVRCLQ